MNYACVCGSIMGYKMHFKEELHANHLRKTKAVERVTTEK